MISGKEFYVCVEKYLAEFSKSKPSEKILEPYFAGMTKLKENGYSYKAIHAFFVEKTRIDISEQSLRKYLKDHMKKNYSSISASS